MKIDIFKTIQIVIISFLALSLAIYNETISLDDVNVPFYLGYTLGPMIISFPIYMFKGKKKFWNLFYKTSLVIWCFQIVTYMIIIIAK